MTWTRTESIPPLLLVAACALLVSFFPIDESDDDWWHLKAGRMLWEGRMGWYSPDLFTFTAKDKIWVNHEWLAQWLFYGFVHVGGIAAANLVKSVLIILTFLLVYHSARRLTLNASDPNAAARAALLAALLALPTSQFTMYLRPPVWTFLFLAVYHQTFLRAARPPGDMGRRLWMLPLLMVVWANLHGGAILGCVVVVLLAVGSLIDAFAPARWSGARADIPFKASVVLAFAVVAASLLNPYGVHLHMLTFEVMSLKWATSRIHEMAPPAFDLIWTVPLLLAPAILGVARFGTWGERFVFLFLLWQGLSHVRHLPLLAVWAAPYAAAALGPLLAGTRKRIWLCPLLAALFMLYQSAGGLLPPGLGVLLVRYAVVAALLAVTIAALLIRRDAWRTGYIAAAGLAIGFVISVPGDRPARFLQAATGTSWAGTSLPDQIGEFIARHHLEAPFLFTRENGAGVLIWNLSPERMPVLTCSRFDLQGVEPIMELESMLWMADAPWEDKSTGRIVPDWKTLWEGKYRTDLVVLEKYADVGLGRVFRLWTYLDSPESGFVRVATEQWPDPSTPDRQYTLFVRKGDQLTRLMKEIGGPVLLTEPRSEP